MANAKDDEEDIIELNDEDQDDEDTSGEYAAKSNKDKNDSEEDESVEIVEDNKDERIAVQGKKSFKEETQEEKRARRRRERQAKNNRNYANRRELETVKETLARIIKENEELRQLAGEFGKREEKRDEQQILTAMQQQNSIYTNAQEAFAKAIAEGDGAAAAAAQRTMHDANTKYSQLSQLRTSASNKSAAEPEKKQETAQRDTRMQQVYTQRFLAQNDWFDPAGGDEDSKIAKEIDNEVAEDGFDPNTKEYWDEVKKRLRKEIPHVFGETRQQTKPRPKQVNGSMGADSASTASKGVKIPARVVQMAKNAGQWDDPKMRKLFINNWALQNGRD